MLLPVNSCRKLQKRNYDLRAKGRGFRAGDLVWVYSPRRKKGRCPKLDCYWVEPCEILEKLDEEVPSTGTGWPHTEATHVHCNAWDPRRFPGETKLPCPKID